LEQNFDINNDPEETSIDHINVINFEHLIRDFPLEEVAEKIVEDSYGSFDFLRKDAIDKFIDFIFKKTNTGYIETLNFAFYTKRMNDKYLEKQIIELLNKHLYPEIILKLLKYFTRSIITSESDLNIAYLIRSEDIIKSIYETFLLFKKDIFITDAEKRSLNVKRIQQFSTHSDNKLSSPLNTAARFKYILEFFLYNLDIDHIYKKEDILLSNDIEYLRKIAAEKHN